MGSEQRAMMNIEHFYSEVVNGVSDTYVTIIRRNHKINYICSKNYPSYNWL